MRVLLIQKMRGIAGSETYYLNLLPALVARGVEAEFVVVERQDDIAINQPFVRELSEHGVRVTRIGSESQMSWKLVRRIAALLRERPADIVQSNLIHADVWLALVKRLFLPRLKFISTKHGYSEAYQRQYGFDPRHLTNDRFALLTRLAATQADRVVAISKGLGDLLSNSGLISREKITVIPYGFSFEEAITELSPGEARAGEPQLVTVGRLVPVKQHELLVRALPAIISRFPNVKVAIVGSGPEEQRLKELAAELRVAERIVWTGFVRNTHDYLRDSDIFVFTSAAEGFGAVTLEAWYNELPVVAFNVPAQNEIVTDGQDGYLVKPFELEELQARIFSLLSDEGLRRRMGRNGRATYERSYTVEVMATRTLELYLSVLDGEKPDRPSAKSAKAMAAR